MHTTFTEGQRMRSIKQMIREWLEIDTEIDDRYIHGGRVSNHVRRDAGLPTSFKLRGKTWRVQMLHSITRISPQKEYVPVYGLCCPADLQILIARTIDGRICTPREIQATLIHEFLHAAMYAIGREEWTDEHLVHGLEQMFMQYAETARGINHTIGRAAR